MSYAMEGPVACLEEWNSYGLSLLLREGGTINSKKPDRKIASMFGLSSPQDHNRKSEELERPPFLNLFDGQEVLPASFGLVSCREEEIAVDGNRQGCCFHRKLAISCVANGHSMEK